MSPISSRTVPVKGIAALHVRKARVLHAHYTQCPLSMYVQDLYDLPALSQIPLHKSD